jgi:flagellar biosynthetic protein FliR
MDNILQDILVGQSFAVVVLFARLGSAIMLFPAFGESFIYARSRLLLALSMSVMLAPMLQQYLPPLPAGVGSLAVLLLGEITIGVFIGLVARFLVNALHVAGMIFSFQTGLSLATQFDATQASQGSVIGAFMSMSGIMLIFAMDLHHVMLRGVVDSYSLMPSNQFPPIEQMSDYLSTLTSHIFRIGVQLAAPSIVVGLLLYLAAGLLARLMPNMQVFFVIMPLQLFIGLFLLMACFNDMMLEFVQFFSTTFSDFLEGI